MAKRILGSKKGPEVSKDGMVKKSIEVLMLPIDMPEVELRHVAGSVFDLLGQIHEKKLEKKAVVKEINDELKSLEVKLEAARNRAIPYQKQVSATITEDHRTKQVVIAVSGQEDYSRTMTAAEATDGVPNGEPIAPEPPKDEATGAEQAEAIEAGRKTPTAEEMRMPK